MKANLIILALFLLLTIVISITFKRHKKPHKHKKGKHSSKKSKKHKNSKHSKTHQTKNVYVYNNHFHLDKLPPHKNIQNIVPNVVHTAHRHHLDLVHRSAPVRRIPYVHHHVPTVHWVNDNHSPTHAQVAVVHHNSVPHTHADLIGHNDLVHSVAHTTQRNLVHPDIVPSISHLDHYPHHDVATYHVNNHREAGLVYDNVVAPNPNHQHAHVK